MTLKMPLFVQNDSQILAGITHVFGEQVLNLMSSISSDLVCYPRLTSVSMSVLGRPTLAHSRQPYRGLECDYLWLLNPCCLQYFAAALIWGCRSLWGPHQSQRPFGLAIPFTWDLLSSEIIYTKQNPLQTPYTTQDIFHPPYIYHHTMHPTFITYHTVHIPTTYTTHNPPNKHHTTTKHALHMLNNTLYTHHTTHPKYTTQQALCIPKNTQHNLHLSHTTHHTTWHPPL
jgi:hypothetical protein